MPGNGCPNRGAGMTSIVIGVVAGTLLWAFVVRPWQERQWVRDELRRRQ